MSYQVLVSVKCKTSSGYQIKLTLCSHIAFCYLERTKLVVVHTLHCTCDVVFVSGILETTMNEKTTVSSELFKYAMPGA